MVRDATPCSKFGSPAKVTEVENQPGRYPYIGLTRVKRVGMQVIGHDAKREPRSQVPVVTSSEGVCAPNAFKSTLLIKVVIPTVFCALPINP